MSKTLSDRSFMDLVPASIAGDDKVKGLASGVTDALDDVTAQVPSLLILSRIDQLPEPVLDLLAWQLHVDYWETGLPLARKQTLVKKSILMHRYKGTPGIIEQFLEDVLGLKAHIREWYEYDATARQIFGDPDPYHFHMGIDADEFRALTIEETRQLMDVVQHYKNVRSWLDGLVYTAASAADMASAGGAVYVARDQGRMVNHIQHDAKGAFQSAGTGGVSAGRDRAETSTYHGDTGGGGFAVSTGAVSAVTDFSRAE